jgi:cellulose synthase/poly-beta-1,6-N-acetylglucosamine synthase-like glycosyltransferase
MNILDAFYFIFSLIAIYLSVVWIIIFIQNRKTLFKQPRLRNFPSVTFLVPAYNEEKHIESCLKSLVNLDYPKDKLKIIVVNDGSTDKTADIAKKFKGVTVVYKKNEGSKAAAMNYGMKFVDTELVACMDADSFASKDYLKKVIGHFKDDKVGAVTSAVKIKRVTNIVSKIQWVEYLMSVIFRKLFSILNCQFVVPGPGGIYRTNVLKKVGSFETNNLTEDMEMALRLQVNGYKIENCLDAYVYTECPNDFKTLFKQRMRWYRGYLENFKKYFYVFLNPEYGNFGVFFLPATIVWICFVTALFLIQSANFIYDSYNSLVMWSLINYGFVMPNFYFNIFKIDSIFLALTISFFIGLLLSWIGIKTGGTEKIKGRKFSYLIYMIIYPFLFSLFWFCAIVLHMLRVKRKW